MTANLVAYWRHEEDIRHNLNVENLTAQAQAEAARHNRAAEAQAARQIALGYAQLAETARHNREQEAVAISNNLELVRHNQSTEGIQMLQQSETVRHNTEMETLESREVFTKQRRQDLDEQKFELQKTQYVTNTILESGNLLTRAANAITSLFGIGSKSKKK